MASPEPSKSSGEISLREHFDEMLAEADKRYQQRFDAQTKAIDAALQAAKEAVTKAETANDKRFEGVNEMRGSLNDMVSSLMPRAEGNTRFDALAEKIDLLKQRIDTSEGSGGGMRQGWAYLIGAIGIAATLISVVIALRG